MQRAAYPITIIKTSLKISLLIFLMANQAYTQVSSQKGWFTVDFDAGCVPMEVTLTNTGVRTGALFVDFMGDPNDPFSNVGFTDTFNPGETLNNTYNTASTFLIRVVDQSGAGAVEDRFDFIEINVIDAVAPSFTVGLCSNNEITLTFDFASDNYDFYEIDYGDGTAPVRFNRTGTNEIRHIYPAQDNYTINVQGRLSNGADSNCGAAPPVTISTLEIIRTPEITGLTVTDDQTVELQYATLTENVLYRLLVNDNASAFTATIDIDPTTNPDEFVYILPSPIANTADLLFQITALEACGVVQNTSATIRNVRIDYTAEYNTSNFVFTTNWTSSFDPAELQSVSLFFDGNEEAAETLPSGQNERILNSCLDIRPFFYQINTNGAFSRSLTLTPDLSSNPLTPPVLTNLTGRLAGSAVILSYDVAPVFTSEYRIYNVTDTGQELIGTTSDLNFTATDFELRGSEACFVVSYVDECGFEAPVTEEICFEFTPTLILPNAFSPNGDRENDTFGVPPGIYPDFQIQIFNRWGRLVFISRNPDQAWDGTFNGQEAPLGRYVYRINYNFSPNSPVALTGSITLIR